MALLSPALTCSPLTAAKHILPHSSCEARLGPAKRGCHSPARAPRHLGTGCRNTSNACSENKLEVIFMQSPGIQRGRSHSCVAQLPASPSLCWERAGGAGGPPAGAVCLTPTPLHPSHFDFVLFYLQSPSQKPGSLLAQGLRFPSDPGLGWEEDTAVQQHRQSSRSP